MAIAILAPEPDLPAVTRDDRHTHRSPHSRREQVLDLLRTDPERRWRSREIARHLGDVTLGSMYRQLTRQAEGGLVPKWGPGIYTANT